MAVLSARRAFGDRPLLPQRAASANWAFFGAPAGLFCYIHRDMGPPQWADVGMYLQTVMLLLRAEGLHSCPQMAWSVYRKTVAQLLSPPDGLILFCGMSIGCEDTTVVHPRSPARRWQRRSRSRRRQVGRWGVRPAENTRSIG